MAERGWTGMKPEVDQTFVLPQYIYLYTENTHVNYI